MLSQKMSNSLLYNFIKIVAICHCKDIRPLFPSEQNSGLSFHRKCQVYFCNTTSIKGSC